jgi:hypothetical protein
MKYIITETQYNNIFKNTNSKLLSIGTIPNKGLSLISNKHIKKGEEIATILSNTPNEIGRKISGNNDLWETKIGRYINHSNSPNTRASVKNDKVVIIAIKDIREGDEVTVNYGSLEDMLGVDKGTWLMDWFID